MSNDERRPIHVIGGFVGGFVGSGKTTLLLRMLERAWADGESPAVIMNEYGERSVDGKLLGDHDHKGDLTVAELVSGCVCCDLAGGLTDAVISLLRTTSGPIFVETTGLAIVDQIARAIERARRDAGARRGRAALASVIVTVDATRFRAVSRCWRHMSADLRAADTIVLTKCDRVAPTELDRLEALLRFPTDSSRSSREPLSAKTWAKYRSPEPPSTRRCPDPAAQKARAFWQFT